MSLSKITRIDESKKQLHEGPFDFIRGASAEAGRKVKNSGVGRAVGDMVNAGRDASRSADLQKAQQQAQQAMIDLGGLVQQFFQMNGGQEAEDAVDSGNAANPRPADNGQQPHQQQTDNVQQTANTPAPAQASPAQAPGQQAQAQQPRMRPRTMGQPGQHVTPDAFRTTKKPKGRQGKNGFEYTFDSFLQATFDDQQQLDEGPLDFIRGAAGEGVRKMVDRYQKKPSLLKDLYQAGARASAAGRVNKVQKQIEQKAAAIADLITRSQLDFNEVFKGAAADMSPAVQRGVAFYVRKQLRAQHGQVV